MKISTNSAAAVLLTGAFLATSCANDVETSVNTDPQGNAISFTASVGRSSRATEINLDNLGDFAVMARGMHPNGTLYDHFLIGDADNGGEIAHFKSLTTEDGVNKFGTWTLDRSVYWPASLNRVLFIGYTTLKRGTNDESESSASGVLGSAVFSIKNDKPTISNFSPLKLDLTAANTSGVWADGAGQKDLLVAFKQQDRGTKTTVDLNFRHALTQVSITAKQKDKDTDDNRIVKVKGAWIVNAAKTGELTADISVTGGEATNKTSWTATGTETYGSYYNDIIYLKKDNAEDLLHESLMLVPQNLAAWNKITANTGAYIMLLCRVELEHKGITHDGADITDIAIVGDDEATGHHYHQLFPVNTEKYDGSEYGFVCVPLSTDWATVENNAEDCKGAGKHYTYVLDICGAKTGAGIYPPFYKAAADNPAVPSGLIPSGAEVSAYVLNETTHAYETKTVTLNPVVTLPGGKSVGDNVLDEPIKFSVTVSDWAEEDKPWTDGGKPETPDTPSGN